MARTPLYQKIEADMIARIHSGAWEVGLRLPNEFGLAAEFGVSQGTMRRALISLEQQGYLSRKPGRGTIVASEGPAPEAGTFARPCLLDVDGTPLTLEPFRGRSGTRAASPRDADQLGTARVSYLERTLKHAGARAALEELAVSEAVLPELSEDAPADLWTHLSDAGHAPARIEATAHAEITDMAQSVALSCDRHTALLCVRSTAFDTSDRPIAVQLLKLTVSGAHLVHISG